MGPLTTSGFSTSTPSGKAMFGMLGVFAEFERAIIQERVKSGMSRAKAAGVIFGHPKVAPKVEQQIRALLEQGVGVWTICKRLGVGSSTCQRIRNEMLAEK
jgi:DNA invertase Pin-like site-specific DNA recombinase